MVKTDKEFWEDVWGNTIFNNYIGIEKYLALNKKFNDLLKRFISKGDMSILEIGCAKAKKLIYFYKEYGFKIYGIDYSESGVNLARRNLERANVNGVILQEDLFKTSLPKESFDIVYSMGLLEHFENPTDVLDIHMSFLKRGGIIIITIPNFNNSLYSSLIKFLGKENMIAKTHNLNTMTLKSLRDISLAANIEILSLDYLGPIDLSLVFSGIKNIPMMCLAHIINQIIGYLTYSIPSSAYFSPHLVMIGKKRSPLP